jgi:hypothetical protein
MDGETGQFFCPGFKAQQACIRLDKQADTPNLTTLTTHKAPRMIQSIEAFFSRRT